MDGGGRLDERYLRKIAVSRCVWDIIVFHALERRNMAKPKASRRDVGCRYLSIPRGHRKSLGIDGGTCFNRGSGILPVAYIHPGAMERKNRPFREKEQSEKAPRERERVSKSFLYLSTLNDTKE